MSLIAPQGSVAILAGHLHFCYNAIARQSNALCFVVLRVVDGMDSGYWASVTRQGAWGFTRDVRKAFEWYRRSASEGDACGLHNVGVATRTGSGVRRTMAGRSCGSALRQRRMVISEIPP